MSEEIAVSGDDEKSRLLKNTARLVYMLLLPVVALFAIPAIGAIFRVVAPAIGEFVVLFTTPIIELGAPIVGVIISSIKKKAAKGTWLESHFRWQISTFWYSLVFALIWGVLAGLLGIRPYIFAILSGVFISSCWVTYRIIKGWFNLHRNRPVVFRRS